jgi:hypothetical protein
MPRRDGGEEGRVIERVRIGERGCDQSGAIRRVEPQQQSGNVRRRSSLRDVELVRDLLVREPARDEREHMALPGGDLIGLEHERGEPRAACRGRAVGADRQLVRGTGVRRATHPLRPVAELVHQLTTSAATTAKAQAVHLTRTPLVNGGDVDLNGRGSLGRGQRRCHGERDTPKIASSIRFTAPLASRSDASRSDQRPARRRP